MNYCFITNELYPCDKGGIGRLLHNIVLSLTQVNDEARIYIILPFTKKPLEKTLRDAFPDSVSFVFCSATDTYSAEQGYRLPSSDSGLRPLNDATVEALLVLDAISRAEQALGTCFDVIETPDHEGIGAFLMRAKAAGQALQNTVISCRIHSTFSIISEHEPFHHARGTWAATRLDLERETLANADLCIAHLDVIAKANAAHFALGPEWLNRTYIAFPPVLDHQPIKAARPLRASPVQFLFSSRFQPFKRPELFIRAALRFIANNPESDAVFRMISYSFDPLYVDGLRLLVPREHRDRITIETHYSAESRAESLASGILVLPSAYESLCVLAYEAGASGQPVLLSRDCAAFGSNSRWVDGENCLMFDPTADDLARVMQRSLTWQPRIFVDCTADAVYPETIRPQQPKTAGTDPDIAIWQITDHPASEEFKQTELSSLGIAIRQFAKQCPQADQGFTSGECLRAEIDTADTEIIVLCTDHAIPRADFIRLAKTGVKPGVALSTNAIQTDGEADRLVVFTGSMPHLSLGPTPIAPPCLAMHRDDLPALLSASDDKDLMERMLARLRSGALKFILAPIPCVTLTAPQTRIAPNRNLHAFGRIALSHLQRIGLDLPAGQAEPTLRRAATAAIYAHDGQNHEQTVTLELTDITQTLELSIVAPPHRFVLVLACSLSAGVASTATLSLHANATSDEAAKADALGMRRRQIKDGQSYQMRWGPFEPETNHFQLVVKAAAPAILQVAETYTLIRE